MNKIIDLHTHSVHSDGSMTPGELVRHALENGVAAISLTDHDGIGGLKEAIKEGEKIGVEVIPGVELSVQSETETHILGYYIDPDSVIMKNALCEIMRVRELRNIDTAKKLKENKFDITIEDAAAFAGGKLVARAHFAKAMVSKGYVSSVREAFDRYLANGCPCYSSMQALSPEEGVSLIRDSGGLAFAAHLHLTNLEDDDLYEFLKHLKSVGLSGIEGYYTEYTLEMQAKYMKMAEKLGLGISGGTDFHGAMKPHIKIGRGTGNLEIPYSVLEGIKDMTRGVVN